MVGFFLLFLLTQLINPAKHLYVVGELILDPLKTSHFTDAHVPPGDDAHRERYFALSEAIRPTRTTRIGPQQPLLRRIRSPKVYLAGMLVPADHPGCKTYSAVRWRVLLRSTPAEVGRSV